MAIAVSGWRWCWPLQLLTVSSREKRVKKRGQERDERERERTNERVTERYGCMRTRWNTQQTGMGLFALRCTKSTERESEGLLPEQKITAALRMLAYGASADQVDEITRMGKSTILEALMRFCGAVESLYTAEYLRKPTHRDLQRLLKKGEMRGFPGMIGSIDCMH
ncbi:uncharacterized protein [Malus domestica]|uniref:uncharacterized protein n=1 Tax=Malus domestica TaxID=3750 RepID=UPI003976F503